MLVRHSLRCIYLLGWLWLPLQIYSQTPLGGHADPSGSGQPPAAQSSAPAANATRTGRELFKVHCEKCHGADGTGRAARGPLPEITDFTDPSWHERRDDEQLLASILDGKGKDMPAFRAKIGQDRARAVVAHVRSFDPTTNKSGKRPERASASPNGFEDEVRRLEKEMEAVKKQLRQLSEESIAKERSKPPEPSPPPSKPSQPSPAPDAPKPSSPAATGAPDVRELFRQHCVKCHGEDGTGTKARRKTGIPNFTDTSWQARRDNAQLLASVLDGKGDEMPPFREKLSEEQARNLITHVRTFAGSAEKAMQNQQEWPGEIHPWTGKSGDDKAAAPASDETGESQPPGCFLQKLVPWLGTFHPPSVHFPIALLTVAAVAELLRMVTSKQWCDTVSRYCVWFGTLTAVPAGVLGWCRVGFHLVDASWVVTTHRWLGTSTVAGAVLVLVLSELSRRKDRPRMQMCFRFALLVVAAVVLVTGFFGGAVVFGLHHYAWPG
jgi:mono/diheme cytochrome c family protein/uncharacterized membrane protein